MCQALVPELRFTRRRIGVQVDALGAEIGTEGKGPERIELYGWACASTPLEILCTPSTLLDPHTLYQFRKGLWRLCGYACYSLALVGSLLHLINKGYIILATYF